MRLFSVKTYVGMLCALFLHCNTYAEQDIGSDIPDTQQARAGVLAYVQDVFKPVPAEPYWYVQTSVYTRHFTQKSEHNNNQELIGLERHSQNSYLLGAATFIHSYGQRSYYGYAGKRFDFDGTPFYAKVTAGLLYGYKGKYRNKIPFNRFEIAPVIIPSLGVKYQRVSAEVVLLGAAASMINLGLEL